MTTLTTFEKSLEVLATPAVSPSGADTNKVDSWVSGNATLQPGLAMAGSALQILYGISDSNGLGTALSKAGNELATLLQEAGRALKAFADALATATNTTAGIQKALNQAMSGLPPGEAQDILSSISTKPDDLLIVIQANMDSGRIALYQIAQELQTLSMALKPGGL